MLTKAFAQLLIEEKTTVESVERALTRFHLLSLLPSILGKLKQHQNELQLLDTVHIETPYPLSEDNKYKITKLLKAEQKVVEITENKSLLAGFRARYRQTMVDSSMERILNKFINN